MNNTTRPLSLGEKYDNAFGHLLPRYALFSAPFCLVLDCAVYWFAKLVQSLTKWPYHALVLSVDRATPFVPAFIWVYVGCFVFWIVTFALISRTGRDRWFRFFTANALGLLICGLFFIFFPTKIDRPEVTGTGITAWLTRFIYLADSPSVDLFPSIHCFGSWMAFIGVRGQKRFPLRFRIFVPVFALLVCCSTLFIKQHFFLDTIAGIALAELVWLLLNKKPSMAAPAERLFNALDSKVFPR